VRPSNRIDLGQGSFERSQGNSSRKVDDKKKSFKELMGEIKSGSVLGNNSRFTQSSTNFTNGIFGSALHKNKP